MTVTPGGFFDIGEDEIVVHWNRLFVAAVLGSLVLPVDDAIIDAAPTGATDRHQLNTFSQVRCRSGRNGKLIARLTKKAPGDCFRSRALRDGENSQVTASCRGRKSRNDLT